MQATDVRARIGADMLLGVSVQNGGAGSPCTKTMVRTILVSERCFTTRQNRMPTRSVGKNSYKSAKAVHIPVVAIGGISRENLLSLAGTGIEGVALVVRHFCM
jgi:thiamine-phosphate pyrophosphorylase